MSESTSNEQQQSVNLLPQEVKILKTHKELIEKKSREINLAWKLIPAILYFLCALTGYSTSILFHIFWHDIFTGNCPLWAQMVPPARTRLIRVRNALGQEDETVLDIAIDDWRKNLLIVFKHEYNCKFYHAVCLCSCLFGVVWCMLFARCASGIYGAQWLIVPPALIFQIAFTIIVINTMQDFEIGYAKFVNELQDIASMFMNRTEMAEFPKSCNLVDHYLQIYNLHPNRICNIHIALEVLSWIMVLCWIGGLFFLILRIIVVNDFRLRKTITYEVSVEQSIPITEEIVPEIQQPKSRWEKIFFFLYRNQES